MYLPRSLISHLYNNLVKTHHPLSPPVLILVALEPDALCACRILTALLKRDYIPHKIKPITGYGDLAATGEQLVRPMRLAEGGSGGVVVCLGVGGLVDLESILGLDMDEDGSGGLDGVDIWILDARRPWNLANVFGGLSQPLQTAQSRPRPGVDKGQLTRAYQPGEGGIIVFDDGDIQDELAAEREAWCALETMPDIDDDGESDTSETDDETVEPTSRKRKSWSGNSSDDGHSEDEDDSDRPRQRRRSNSSTPINSSSPTPSRNGQLLVPNSMRDTTPPSNQQSSQPLVSASRPPSSKTLRRRLLRLRRRHDATVRAYHGLGTSYSEPISSLMYSLASELGRDDNDLLWLAIVGVSSTELYGRTATGLSLTNHDATTQFTGWNGSRGSRIRHLLRDEVRRLNPPIEFTNSGHEVARGHATDVIPTHARSPTDTGIRLSPEPRFLLVRHWSLYDSMLHSPYLSARLHVWSDVGRRRLHKLLAKMGVSLTQCKQSYTHMDLELKRTLRERLLHFAPVYGLDGLVPPASTSSTDRDGWGFVRTWGWKACLSATDVAVVIGAILELGTAHSSLASTSFEHGLPTPPGSVSSQMSGIDKTIDSSDDELMPRFYAAYDALLSPSALTKAIPVAQSLHRAILRTGTALLQKRQIRHLRAFRMGLVREGPDVKIFCAPGALTKLALWIGEAVAEADQTSDVKRAKYGSTPLVLGCLDEARDVYVVVGLGGAGSLEKVVNAKDADREKRRKAKADEREKRRAERKKQKEVQRRAREAADVSSDEEDETESEGSDSSESDSESDDDETKKRFHGSRNRFGNAFQQVVAETSARVRLDSFEHCVVEVRKEDLSGFLESLSMKAVVG